MRTGSSLVETNNPRIDLEWDFEYLPRQRKFPMECTFLLPLPTTSTCNKNHPHGCILKCMERRVYKCKYTENLLSATHAIETRLYRPHYEMRVYRS